MVNPTTTRPEKPHKRPALRLRIACAPPWVSMPLHKSDLAIRTERNPHVLIQLAGSASRHPSQHERDYIVQRNREYEAELQRALGQTSGCPWCSYRPSRWNRSMVRNLAWRKLFFRYRWCGTQNDRPLVGGATRARRTTPEQPKRRAFQQSSNRASWLFRGI